MNLMKTARKRILARSTAPAQSCDDRFCLFARCRCLIGAREGDNSRGAGLPLSTNLPLNVLKDTSDHSSAVIEHVQMGISA
jgi:hypothetical protein